MENIFRICLFLTGIVNLLPSILSILPSKISKSYGISISDVNLELLIRHRAIFFALIGGLLIYSSITKKLYNLSFLFGMISMVSFVLLYFQLNGINAELEKVMKIDIIAIVILLIGFVLFKLK